MRNKYSISDKRKILNDYLSNKNDYASIKEYAHLHGINPSTMHDFLRQSDEIAPYTIIDLHLNTGSTLYHGRVSAASEVIDKYGTYTVGMVMVNHATGGIDIIIYKE